MDFTHTGSKALPGHLYSSCSRLPGTCYAQHRGSGCGEVCLLPSLCLLSAEAAGCQSLSFMMYNLHKINFACVSVQLDKLLVQ